jgi:antitoxin PrlF
MSDRMLTEFIDGVELAGNANLHYITSLRLAEGNPMASLAVTAKGQVTLKRELLQHLGVKPGERIEFDKLPDGTLRLKAARPAGSIESFIGRHAGKVKTPLSIEEMNEIAAASWAGDE